MAHASFNGLRVLSLESRRAKEVAKLIRTYGGEPFVVPAMREIPLESNQQALDFARDLMAGSVDLVVFLTGVGVRALLDIVQTKYSRDDFLAALRSVKVACRGPKPLYVLNELKVPVTLTAPEPSTWRELMTAIETEFGESLAGFHVAVQEYGASNPELLSELTEKTSQVTKVPVYQWALPEDVKPLRECVLGVANGSVDVVLFMTAVQVIHLFLVAEQMGSVEELRAGLQSMVVISIGPTTSEELRHYGITPDFEPSRPKMGFLVNEAAQYSGRLVEQKRAGKSPKIAPGRAAPSVPTKSALQELQEPASAAVRRVAASTPTMAGFRDGLRNRFSPRDQQPHRCRRLVSYGAGPYRGICNHGDSMRFLLHLCSGTGQAGICELQRIHTRTWWITSELAVSDRASPAGLRSIASRSRLLPKCIQRSALQAVSSNLPKITSKRFFALPSSAPAKWLESSICSIVSPITTPPMRCASLP